MVHLGGTNTETKVHKVFPQKALGNPDDCLDLNKIVMALWDVWVFTFIVNNCRNIYQGD